MSPIMYNLFMCLSSADGITHPQATRVQGPESHLKEVLQNKTIVCVLLLTHEAVLMCNCDGNDYNCNSIKFTTVKFN
eukprot:4425872-Amphidinium_carterae.1